MRDKEIINIDFQGWPVYKMNIRKILIALGAKFNKTTNKFEIDNDPSLLDVYPLVMEDDGMGFGVNEKYIVEVSPFDSEKEGKSANIFIDSKLSEEELDKCFGIE